MGMDAASETPEPVPYAYTIAPGRKMQGAGVVKATYTSSMSVKARGVGRSTSRINDNSFVSMIG